MMPCIGYNDKGDDKYVFGHVGKTWKSFFLNEEDEISLESSWFNKKKKKNNANSRGGGSMMDEL